jgi:hypothetical protein
LRLISILWSICADQVDVIFLAGLFCRFNFAGDSTFALPDFDGFVLALFAVGDFDKFLLELLLVAAFLVLSSVLLVLFGSSFL